MDSVHYTVTNGDTTLSGSLLTILNSLDYPDSCSLKGQLSETGYTKMEDRVDSVSVSTEKAEEDDKFIARDPEDDDSSDCFCKVTQTASSAPKVVPVSLNGLALDLSGSGRGAGDSRRRAESLSSGYVTITECCDALSPLVTSPGSAFTTPFPPVSESGHNLTSNSASTPTHSPAATPSPAPNVADPLPLSPVAGLSHPANQFSVNAATGERTYSMKDKPPGSCNESGYIQDKHPTPPQNLIPPGNLTSTGNEFGSSLSLVSDICSELENSPADACSHPQATLAVPVASDYIQSDSYNVAALNTDAVACVGDCDAISLSEEEEEEEEGSQLPVHVTVDVATTYLDQPTSSDYIQDSSAVVTTRDYQQSRKGHLSTQLSLAEQVEADAISLPPMEELEERQAIDMSPCLKFIKDSSSIAVTSSDYIDSCAQHSPPSTLIPLDDPDAISLPLCEEVYLSEEESFGQCSAPPPPPPPSPPSSPLFLPHDLDDGETSLAITTTEQPVNSSGYITDSTKVIATNINSPDTYQFPSSLSLVSSASFSDETYNHKPSNILSDQSPNPPRPSSEIISDSEFTYFPELSPAADASKCFSYPPQNLDIEYPSGHITAR